MDVKIPHVPPVAAADSEDVETELSDFSHNSPKPERVYESLRTERLKNELGRKWGFEGETNIDPSAYGEPSEDTRGIPEQSVFGDSSGFLLLGSLAVGSYLLWKTYRSLTRARAQEPFSNGANYRDLLDIESSGSMSSSDLSSAE